MRIDDFLIDRVAQPCGEWIATRSGIGVHGQAVRTLNIALIVMIAACIAKMLQYPKEGGSALLWGGFNYFCWRIEWRRDRRKMQADAEFERSGSLDWSAARGGRVKHFFERCSLVGLSIFNIVGDAAILLFEHRISAFAGFYDVAIILWTIAFYLHACRSRPPGRRSSARARGRIYGAASESINW